MLNGIPMFATNPRQISAALLVCLASVITASPCAMAQILVEGGFSEDCLEEPATQYGPGECQPRMTLFQWSYGTSFSGGNDLDENLVADRPDFTEASTTVRRGVVQLEFGYTYFRDSENGNSTTLHSIGEPLLRIGMLADWFELRLAVNYEDESQSNAGVSTSATGLNDLYIGAKIGLTPQEGILPEMALIPQMTVPTGDSPFNAHQVLPGVNWIYAWELTDKISLAGQTQLNRAIEEVGLDYHEFSQSAVIGYSFTDNFVGFLEWFSLNPIDADAVKPEYYMDGGFAVYPTKNLQLDVRAGVGLNEAAIDYFVGVGGVVRYY